MAKLRDEREEKALTRGLILEVLQASVDRERGDEENVATYLDEDVIYLKIGRRYPQTREMMRGHLFYMKDKEYVKFREVRVGKSKSLMWRITARGTDLLEGNVADAGVHVE